ncbi:hypothetical protein LZ32DRAFT_280868 [Colletotrichum eremochloae]|nr:hypothetical protein LZ32DRAFT_280868 [Colletotrichum eremochloae]
MVRARPTALASLCDSLLPRCSFVVELSIAPAITERLLASLQELFGLLDLNSFVAILADAIPPDIARERWGTLTLRKAPPTAQFVHHATDQTIFVSSAEAKRNDEFEFSRDSGSKVERCHLPNASNAVVQDVELRLVKLHDRASLLLGGWLRHDGLEQVVVVTSSCCNLWVEEKKKKVKCRENTRREGTRTIKKSRSNPTSFHITLWNELGSYHRYPSSAFLKVYKE